MSLTSPCSVQQNTVKLSDVELARRLANMLETGNLEAGSG